MDYLAILLTAVVLTGCVAKRTFCFVEAETATGLKIDCQDFAGIGQQPIDLEPMPLAETLKLYAPVPAESVSDGPD
jgi:PBP1b-binding outer membrane lipoprotein LpoB